MLAECFDEYDQNIDRALPVYRRFMESSADQRAFGEQRKWVKVRIARAASKPGDMPATTQPPGDIAFRRRR